jgi:hypothetical protein
MLRLWELSFLPIILRWFRILANYAYPNRIKVYQVLRYRCSRIHILAKYYLIPVGLWIQICSNLDQDLAF